MSKGHLPNLRRFVFKGVSAYLEGLVARIRAPLLSMFHINFFNQLTFTIPHLLRFMSTSKNLRFSTVRLDFDTNAVILMADHCGEWEISPFRMRSVLSVAHNLSSEQHNELDRIQWRELLRSFNNVKTLRVQNELVEKLARSLRSGGGDADGQFALFINEREAAGHPVSPIMVDDSLFD
ncbi:hypothetical protein BJV78DRAFT_1265722 [Lactifluus subvellereus]|nr:hypothetical protein BJV78DRAFT_1265722 [Lactifluus subvellereus]